MLTDVTGSINNYFQHGQRKSHQLACPCNSLLMRHLQLQKYLALPQKGKVIAEYVWIDGSNGIRSKSKVSNFLACRDPTQYTAAFVHPAEMDRSSLGSLAVLAARTNRP